MVLPTVGPTDQLLPGYSNNPFEVRCVGGAHGASTFGVCTTFGQDAQRAGLTLEEVIALRLYTGAPHAPTRASEREKERDREREFVRVCVCVCA